MKKQFFSIIMLLSMTTSMVAGQSQVAAKLQSRAELVAAREAAGKAYKNAFEKKEIGKTLDDLDRRIQAAEVAELEAAKASETPVVKSNWDYLTNAGSAISEKASQFSSIAKEKASQFSSIAKEKTSQVASIIKENPKASAAGVGVVGLGYAAYRYFKSSPKKLTNQFDYKALGLNFLVAYKLEGDNATEMNLTDKSVVDALAKITDEDIKSLESNVFLQDNNDTSASFVIIDSIELHFSMKTTSIEEMKAVLSSALSTFVADNKNSDLSTSDILSGADVTGADVAPTGDAGATAADVTDDLSSDADAENPFVLLAPKAATEAAEEAAAQEVIARKAAFRKPAADLKAAADRKKKRLIGGGLAATALAGGAAAYYNFR